MEVTTLIANYNYGHYIGRAIDSALSQTVKNYLVIVDDKSTDYSVNFIKDKLSLQKTTEDDDCIKYEADNVLLIALKQNGGPSRARNFGFKHTLHRSKYFQILDADDAMYPKKIEELLKFCDRNVGAVYADYHIQNMRGIIVPEFKEPFSAERLTQSCIIHSGSLLNAEAVAKVGGYREDMRVAEDYNLWVRMMKAGYTFIHVPEFLTLVRDHNENSTNTVPKEVWHKCWSEVWR